MSIRIVRRGAAMRNALIAAGLFFVVLLGIGAVPRFRRQRELQARTHAAEAAPTVTVVPVKRAATAGELSLPGTVQAMREAALYARSNGYVRRFHVDIGARVRTGALLAEIETPEIDQELAQAQASLAQARAAHTLAQTTLQRWQSMVKDSAATRQELDERQAAFNATAANVAAADANARRLAQLRNFGRVTAPFAGTVTARNVEVGQLVSPGGGTARPLFVLAQADTGRVMINVPEGAAPQLRVGAEADVLVRGLGTLKGRVARTAGALDEATRTMLAEVDVPNPTGVLLPGMYAQVKLGIHSAMPSILLPANALITRGAGPQAAVVRNGKVSLVKLELGRDLGTDVEVTSGLAEGDQVVINPSDDVAAGATVRTVSPAPAAKP